MKTRMHISTRSLFWLLVVVMTLGTSRAYADDNDVVVMNTDSSPRSLSRGELQSLPPVFNRLKAPDTSRVTPDTEAGPHLDGAKAKDGSIRDVAPRAFGSFGIPYTTTRVQDGNQSAAGTTSDNHLSTTYPYRTVGKLTFSAGYCSASLILRSVIVTAAHCIQDFGTGNNLFSNFQFRPGHYGAAGATAAQIAPYGTWAWIGLVRPGTMISR